MAAVNDGLQVRIRKWALTGTPTSFSRYLVAATALAAALLFRYLFRDSLGLKAPYLQFYPALIVAAWYGGPGPGVAVTAASTIVAMYWLLPPSGPAVGDPSDQLSLGVFVATGLAIAWLNHRLHAAREAQLAVAAAAAARAERLDAILNTTADGVIVIDATGVVESFNPAAERLFGYPVAEVVGRNVSLLMPSPHHEEHDNYLHRYITTGEARIIGIGREVTGRRRDGTLFPVHLAVGEMWVGGERKFTGLLHDLTERVQLEAQLREQATLARLGEMAAVIAHEVKNPLAGIRGAMQVFGRRLGQDAPAADVIKEIVARIDSLDQMMKDLLLFARPLQPRPEPTDVVTLVGTTAGLLRLDPALRELEIDVSGASPLASADPEMLRIVFQNLLINSAHAMRGKGRIRIQVDTVDSTCRIAFSDAGPGIPVDVREKIFTPFFTTKSRGSGLGLATAKRLVEAHDGQIAIDCPAAGGTTVVVQIPLASA
jgi:two-component system, LuxR family, sensor kinase FixL